MKKLLLSLSLLVAVLVGYGCDNQLSTSEEIPSLTDSQVQEQLDGLKDYGLDLFSKGDYLPVMKNHVFSEQQSSYSRNGNNVDGFGMNGNVSGEVSELSFIRPLLELNQPGVVYRMWFTSWEDVKFIRVYIDGASKPTYVFNLFELTSGEIDPFVKPLVLNQDESSGGFVSYVPIIFKESIRIIGSGNFYYNINYQKYPQGYALEYDDFDTKLPIATEVLSNAGSDPKITNNDTKTEITYDLKQGDSHTIYKSSKKQTVTALKVRFPNLSVNEFDRSVIHDEGHRIFLGGRVTVDLTAKESGQHYLHFRGILTGNEQKASVTVNGTSVGELRFRPRRLDGFEWKDSNYFSDAIVTIPASVVSTGGKLTVSIKATTQQIDVYNVRLVKDAKEVDAVDYKNEDSETKHNFVSSGLLSPTSATLEYDPNELISQGDWAKIHSEEDLINKVFIKITYLDQTTPAVLAPISSFFGFGEFGMFKTLGLMVGLDSDGWMYSYYPMPFEEGIKIELINESSFDLSDLQAQISTETNNFKKGEYGYFKANYTSNLSGTSTALKNGQPMQFLNISGAGHIVGVTHSMSGAYFGVHSRFYLEGDEQIYIDGSLSHSFHGTGTEDFYNGGWYFKNGVQNTPLFGATNHNYRNNRDRTVMVRTFMTDPIYFRNGIDFKMEHGGVNDRPDADVMSIVYYYHQVNSSTILSDMLSLNSDTSRSDHNYQFDSNSNFVSTSQFIYEGFYFNRRTAHLKAAEVSQQSSFNMSIDARNEGVILRREYILEHINQSAKVYVDGEFVGIWQSSFRNAVGIFVRQDDFYILEKFTKDKSNISITIEVMPNDDSDIWTESYYEIYSIVKED